LPEFEKEEVNRVVRHPERGSYDKEVIYQIIDEAIICHVAFVQDGRPFVIPTLHARQGNNILLHGATTSRLIRQAHSGADLCIAMTLLDGLVLARSVFSHSANYRSVVLFGRGTPIETDEDKLRALEHFAERLIPGRWQAVRAPSGPELKATTVVSIPIDHASAKIRQGPPGDKEEDLELPVWAGVVPFTQQAGDPVPDPGMAQDIQVPGHVLDFANSDRA
jgi:nitroimidazol reductase NimA-like FMN-containing flavoprotein (pyridoxamine 5'-phosphate oxidase superfamily)